MTRLTENSTSVLPISSTCDWRPRRRSRFRRWLYRLFRRPLLP